MAFKKYRNIKVYEQSGYYSTDAPMILLKGKWVRELGFEKGDALCVKCEDGKITITKACEIESVAVEIPADYVAENAPVYGEKK